MNPVAILYALSIGCFILAGLIAAYIALDWYRLNKRLRADASFDPVRRPEPDYLKRHRINTKPATRFKP